MTTQGVQRCSSSQVSERSGKIFLHPPSGFEKNPVMPFHFYSWLYLRKKLKTRVLGTFFQKACRTGLGHQTQGSWSCLIAETWPQQLPQGGLWTWLPSPLNTSSFLTMHPRAWSLFLHLALLDLAGLFPDNIQYCLLQRIRDMTCSFIYWVLSVACGGYIIAEGLKAMPWVEMSNFP